MCEMHSSLGMFIAWNFFKIGDPSDRLYKLHNNFPYIYYCCCCSNINNMMGNTLHCDHCYLLCCFIGKHRHLDGESVGE